MANLKLKTLPVFPTKVTGTGGISVNKVNGVWTIDPDWTALALVESVSAAEDKQLWCYDPSSDTYVRLSVDALIDSLPDGPPGGFKQNFGSSTTDADPGAGEFRFNNATVASATAAYLDNADADGADISGLIDLWDNSTSTVKGMVRFEKTTDPSVWAQFEVTGSVVDGTGYRKVTLQNGVSNGTFTAGDRFAVAFFGTGNTPTVSVGTTTTLSAGSSATVANSGTGSDLVLDFGIPRGADASFKWLYEASTSMAAPAAGGMRFNNAALSSVTAVAVNAQTADSGNPDQSDYIVKWDDSTNSVKAYVEIREEAGSSAVFQLSSVTDNTSWLQFNVTYVSGDIDLTAGDALYFTPHLVGNKGQDGLGVGDVVGPASSVDGEIALFDFTTGKLLKRASTTGVLKASSGVLAQATDGTDYLSSTTGIKQGKHTIWVPASAMLSATTSGPSQAQFETSTNDINFRVLDFDASADEHAHFNVAFPVSWNEGTVTFQVFWMSTATDTDGVAWGLQGVAISDNEATDASWGTAIVVTDDAQSAASELYVTSESSPVTIGGTPAAGDVCFFRVFRDVSDANDDMTEDARLIGVKIFYTVNAATDA